MVTILSCPPAGNTLNFAVEKRELAGIGCWRTSLRLSPRTSPLPSGPQSEALIGESGSIILSGSACHEYFHDRSPDGQRTILVGRQRISAAVFRFECFTNHSDFSPPRLNRALLLGHERHWRRQPIWRTVVGFGSGLRCGAGAKSSVRLRGGFLVSAKCAVQGRQRYAP